MPGENTKFYEIYERRDTPKGRRFVEGPKSRTHAVTKLLTSYTIVYLYKCYAFVIRNSNNNR